MDTALVKAALLAKDLSAYSSEQLCVVFALDLYRVLTAIIWAIDDEQRPAHEVAISAQALLPKEPAYVKAEVARRSEDLAEQVVVYRKVLDVVSLELSKRAHPGGLAIWESVTTGGLLDDLVKGLGVERLTDYADSDPRDLQQTALLSAGEQYNREMKEIEAMMPLDFELIPIGTSRISTELRGERWDFWRAARWRFVQGMIIQLLPLVTARFGRIRAASREAYRSEFEHRAAKKRGGRGGRHAKAAGTEQEAVKRRSLSDVAEESIALAPTTGAEKSPYEIAEEREAAQKIIETARAKLGRKAANYFRQLVAEESQKDAAKAANVSDRMARKYEARVRALLHAKKPRA